MLKASYLLLCSRWMALPCMENILNERLQGPEGNLQLHQAIEQSAMKERLRGGEPSLKRILHSAFT